MNLLTYLIPSLRELRAALLAGYLWIVVGWIALGERIPDADEVDPDSALSQLARASDVWGTFGLVVGLSVAAYLLGSFIVDVLDGLLVRVGIQPSLDSTRALGDIAISTRELVRRTERMHAEGQVRVHAALPASAASTLVAFDHSIAFGLVGVLGALLLAGHGIFLWHRTRLLGEAVERAVHEQWSEMGSMDREGRQAELSARGLAEQIIIENKGSFDARSVRITLEDGSEPRFLVADVLPIDVIEPGEQAVIPVALSMADPMVVRIALQWVDGSGERKRVQEVRFVSPEQN